MIESVLIGKISKLMCPSTIATTNKENNAKESIMQTETTMSHNDHTGSNDASEAPNLAVCTTEALFRWLLVNRFNNDEQAVKEYLTQAASPSSHAHPAVASSQSKDVSS